MLSNQRCRFLVRFVVGGLLLVTVFTPFFTLSTVEERSTTIVVGEEASVLHPLIPSERSRPLTTDVVDLKTRNNSGSLCLTDVCIANVASRLARVYPFKTNHSDWIRHEPVASPSTTKRKIVPTQDYISIRTKKDNNNKNVSGIIYVKNFKAASSTAAGIALRIAHRYVHPTNGNPAFCKWSHVRAFNYAQQDRKHSLFFTSVREPSSRALSRIFYTSITQKGESPTDANVLQKLRWNHAQYGAVSHNGGGYQVRYCSMEKTLPPSWDPVRPNEVVDPIQVEQNVKDILLAYDFIMVSERMDESVVAFAMLFNLSVSDVLVMNAKQNSNNNKKEENPVATNNNSTSKVLGDYLYFSWRDRKKARRMEACKLSIPSKRTPSIEAHFQSQEWKAKNYGDYLLHKAVSLSLDRTITEQLGQDRFDQTLHEYRRLKSKAKALCSDETFSHCSPTGEIQRDVSAENCYGDDSGCGYPCIDRMLLTESEPTGRG